MRQGTGGNSNNQIVETGRFDQGIQSTLKKTPNYFDNSEEKERKNANYNNAAILVPELNLSPR